SMTWGPDFPTPLERAYWFVVVLIAPGTRSVRPSRGATLNSSYRLETGRTTSFLWHVYAVTKEPLHHEDGGALSNL
ncbi:MAG: hypothetical protein AAGJ80_09565, partial [Cyanobacteria bacterium J06553_1]